MSNGSNNNAQIVVSPLVMRESLEQENSKLRSQIGQLEVSFITLLKADIVLTWKDRWYEESLICTITNQQL
jgi:hypothetical protein